MTDRDAKYPDSCPFYVAGEQAVAEAESRPEGLDRSALLLRAAILYAISAEGSPAHLPKWKVRIWAAAVAVAREGGFPSFAAILAKKHLTKAAAENLVVKASWLKMVLTEGGS